MRFLYALAFLLGVFARPLFGQHPAAGQPTFYAFVDTAHVTPVGPDTYVTWIFAASVPHPTPLVSSAVFVAFDCANHKVARLYHIVYKLNADSTGVWGDVAEDPGTWVDVSVPKTFDLVCQVGPAHGTWEDSYPEATIPEQPKPDPQMLSPVS